MVHGRSREGVRRWTAAIAVLAISCAARNPPRDTWPADTPVAPSVPASVENAGTVGAPAGAPRTVSDGVYSEEQRQRGQVIYFTTCVRCHKAEMTGSQIVPPIIGEPFLSRWSRKTAGDLFEWVRTSMPPFDTERLSRQQSADVLAYILSRNEFPAGEAELAADFDVLRLIRVAPDQDKAGASPTPRPQPGFR